MKTTTISINDLYYIAHYEYVEAESGDYDYPGTQPTITLWYVVDEQDNHITHTLTKAQWQSVEEQIYTTLEL
tara:strand:+ start:12455 stop:12670 length:216 start_codon:yes stop_codon:yes gene_type:complete